MKKYGKIEIWFFCPSLTTLLFLLCFFYRLGPRGKTKNEERQVKIDEKHGQIEIV